MTTQTEWLASLQSELSNLVSDITFAHYEITITCEASQLLEVMRTLRDNPRIECSQLIDVCGVDYLQYGRYDWETDDASSQGFSRAVAREPEPAVTFSHPRFAAVYHVLSIRYVQRARIKVYLSEDNLTVPSVCEIFRSANWFEREAFDLYGIYFENHPDLRRILTDYGFVGHPFRKDFPLSGHVEMRYDANLAKVIYEPVDIKPRIGVPKVIRHDNRYLVKETGDA